MASLRGVEHVTAVVSGIVWMTRSVARDGVAADRPPRGLAIPIEMAGARLSDYAPFLAPSDQVHLPELAAGQAVLGQSEARLRRMGVGGTLRFGRQSLRVAGIVPDAAIGANEVFLPAPETRASAIRAVVARLAGRPCAWISPVLWKGETGITAVSHANATPCAFFDSSALTVETNADKIHPSPKGGAAWADAVWNATVVPVEP